MGFFLSFVVGAATGAVVTWRIDQRRQHQKEARLDGRFARTEAKPWALRDQQDIAVQATMRPLQGEQEAVPDDLSTVIVLNRLEHIPGVTPRVARRLNQAGILTYADLTKQLPETLYALVASDGTGEMPVQDWIDHARHLACEDNII